jgi:hypothetical protein
MFSNMPPELAQCSRWLVWRGNKVPFCATVPAMTALTNDPDTWASFEQAKTTYEEGGFLGVGFVVNNDGVMGVDLDKCVHDGTPDPRALEILDDLQCAYIEFSPSGNGLRAFGYGEVRKGIRGQHNGINVELYSTGRYFTVTGHVFKSGPLDILSGLPELVSALEGGTYRREQKKTEDDRSHLPSSSVGIPLDNFVPTEEGERNRYLFDLARYVRGKLPNASTEQLRQIAWDWHQLSLPYIRTKEFSVTWSDFQRGLENVKHPFGEILNAIIQKIDYSAPMPDSIEALRYGDKGNYLVRICRQLQLETPDEPFFLSARKAGELLPVHYTDASKMLGALVYDGVLALVSKGSGTKASRYRYAWPE